MKKHILSILLVLLFSVNGFSQFFLKPSIGVVTLSADNTPICYIPWHLGSFYTSGLQKNDTAFDFKLYDLNGDSLELSKALSAKKPVLLIGGNYTCPVFRGKIPRINQVISTYGNQLQVYIINTVEAHPNIDTSVYFGYVQTGQQNINAGILYRQPTTYLERKQVVQDMVSNITINAPIFIDAPCNNWWSKYGPAPNNSYLIDTNGVIVSKHGWFDRYPENIFCDIDSLLGTTSGLCSSGGGGNGTFTFNLLSNDTIIGAAGTTLAIDGELINNSNNDIPVYVKRIINTLPAGWASSLCIDVCYPTSTDSLVFLLPANDTQDFHFYFYTASSPIGTGYAKVGFKNNNNTSNTFMTNLWGITTSAVTVLENYSFDEIIVFPNPAKDYIQIKSKFKNYDVELLNIIGEKIMVAHNKHEFDISTLPNGIYFIRIQADGKQVIKKVVVSK